MSRTVEEITITGRRARPDGWTDETRSLGRGYEWTCPFCGKSRVNRVGGEGDRSQALAALRSHVLSSVDDDHGATNDYPAEYDPADLADHVVIAE